jgi:hypothetical protein
MNVVARPGTGGRAPRSPRRAASRARTARSARPWSAARAGCGRATRGSCRPSRACARAAARGSPRRGSRRGRRSRCRAARRAHEAGGGDGGLRRRVGRFGDDTTPGMREQVATALVGKALLLDELGCARDALRISRRRRRGSATTPCPPYAATRCSTAPSRYGGSSPGAPRPRVGGSTAGQPCIAAANGRLTVRER